MDQQQGAGTGELAALTDVLSGEDIGAVLRCLYVWHVPSFDRAVHLLGGGGPFLFTGVECSRAERPVSRVDLNRAPAFSTVAIQGWAECGELGCGRCWVVKVYDVDHIAGMGKEKAAREGGSLLSGRQYVSGRSSALPVILSPHHESIHWINWMSRITATVSRPTITRSR